MKLVNDLLRPVFDAVQGPLASLPPLVGVLIWSIPVGIFALWVFGKTSNQQQIAAVKRRIHAGLFEIRLFNDDIRAIGRAQFEILRHVARYQLLALKPMLFILPPLVLVMVQLHQFYGFRGLALNEATLLTVRLDPESIGDRRPDIRLDAPDGVAVTTGPIWAPALAEMSWQLHPVAEGDFTLEIAVNGETASKNLHATRSIVRMSPERPPPTFVDQLEWPSEPPLAAGSAFRSIQLLYPEGVIGLFGWSWQWSFAWMVIFFALTMVVALALRKPMGIEL
jgi:hypothetical protein